MEKEIDTREGKNEGQGVNAERERKGILWLMEDATNG